MKPHKYAELIKAWADGAKIQRFKVERNTGVWVDAETPNWFEHIEYRIKPKADVVKYYRYDGNSKLIGCSAHGANLRFVCDGETGKLKSAEVLK